MEKISGILPTNARISAVDTASVRPLRSGTPGFGLPVNETSLESRVAPSAVDIVRVSSEAQDRMMRAKGDVAIADKIEKDFFALHENAGRADSHQSLMEPPTTAPRPQAPQSERPGPQQGRPPLSVHA